MNDGRKTYDKRAFTIKEAAEYACVGRSTLEKWLVRGLLPYEELPSTGAGKYRFRRIRKRDLDEFLDRLYTGNDSADREKSNSKPIILARNS